MFYDPAKKPRKHRSTNQMETVGNVYGFISFFQSLGSNQLKSHF